MADARLLKSKQRNLPKVGYLKITPDMAQAMLEKNKRNRTLSTRRVSMYAAAMIRGDWMVTNQGIAFDEFGDLIDGQHRLAAIVEAGIPIDVLVIEAASNRSQLVLDQGLKRTPHDQIGLREGWNVKPIHTAIAKAMIESIGGAGARERRDTIADIQLMDRFYVKHHKAIEFVVERIYLYGSLKGVIISPTLAPVARAWYTVDHELLVRFLDVLATGQSEGKDESPIIVLRNYLIDGRERQLSARAGKGRNLIYKKTELALHAFINGRQIQRLSSMHLETELFPIPGDKLEKVKVVAT